MSLYSRFDRFRDRHLGPTVEEKNAMLAAIGVSSLDELIDQTIPKGIRLKDDFDIGEAMSEYEYLNRLESIANKNAKVRDYIGQGYYHTLTPSVILRTIFQNPGWYTQYTPYQAEIAQGRLEALLNFQTMVSELTGLPIANASLLDEGTAAAEAMTMFFDQKNKRNKGEDIHKIFVDQHVFEQTKDVLLTRALPLGIEVEIGDWKEFQGSGEEYFAVLLQYPDAQGSVHDYAAFTARQKEEEIFVIVAADILSLALLKSPGSWGADAAVGTTQRFGIPMGFGGPHAAYFATTDKYKRQIPGRIIGVSVDSNDDRAYRMALQTREQHIKREKATSNICTAQALLATMAGMYAVYHGPEGLKAIARRTHHLTVTVADQLKRGGLEVVNDNYFDTLTVKVDSSTRAKIAERCQELGINLFFKDNHISFSLDEACEEKDVIQILQAFGVDYQEVNEVSSILSPDVVREEPVLTHPIFSVHHSETKMMRYIRSLEEKDLSLLHSMIPLGSCTMKLNAATQLIPVSWPQFAHVHPFRAPDQVEGYMQMINELASDLCEITGFTACSLQPNSGAQGEYSGLLTIKAYHDDRGDHHRNVALIPSSAHGTNPASAVMTGMKVVVVACDDMGNIDLDDLKAKCEEHKDHLAALMVTYPSTHGVFEEAIMEICDLVHDHGGLVYMDGANMNAQVGYTNPAMIHADVCHLNLHKTFAIPHGGGGPGMGPICVNDKLAPYLPGHVFFKTGGEKAVPAVSAAPFGSASILIISHAYIKMLGNRGLKDSTAYAILNANYIKNQLDGQYDVLYTGKNGRVAHELIIDLRPYKEIVSAEDVAKRLIDYGFHAPTLSFPVPGTIMIEPTESEDKDELDRFCEAMLAIKGEIDAVAKGDMDAEVNVLNQSPHTMQIIARDDWDRPYTREQAAYPLPYLRHNKFWAVVGRVNNAYGDRNLVCTCPPMEEYM